MYIHLLDLTSGLDYQNGKMIDVPKKVKVQLGTCGFRSFDGRYRIDTITNEAHKMMAIHKNKVGFAIYSGTISNPRLVRSHINSEYSDLETDLQNA